MTMTATHPKWSFVRLDESGMIAEVKEKEVISNTATIGVYGLRREKTLFSRKNDIRK